MDREVLERLATDRAMGALSPDVEHLLTSYLQVDPACAAAAERISNTVTLARQALAEHQPSSMPAFPVAGFQQIERWQKRVQRFTFAAGMAACLTIGLGLGRLSNPKPSVVQVVRAPQSTETVSADVRPEPAAIMPDRTGFWSVERLRRVREQAQAPGTARVQPEVKLPWLGINLPT